MVWISPELLGGLLHCHLPPHRHHLPLPVYRLWAASGWLLSIVTACDFSLDSVSQESAIAGKYEGDLEMSQIR